MLTEGSSIIDFTLLDQDGNAQTLSQYSAGIVLVYFYPKDDTPGCTKEACAITEVYDEFKNAGITVFGISADSPASHKKFRKNTVYHLPCCLILTKKLLPHTERHRLLAASEFHI